MVRFRIFPKFESTIKSATDQITILSSLLRILQSVPNAADSVLLVAHNPGLDDLVEWLAPEPPSLSESGKLMTTAAIAMFAVPKPWAKLKRNTTRLVQLLRPKELA